jgi:ubiquinone/menaquinone biosynthesis C-methylase UbiE
MEIAATYTAAADTFDTLPFWHHFGHRTVERLGLRRGDHVLDLCCGSGASALPAAEAVGPSGRVVGVDITDALLARARAKAVERGYAHATFHCADVASLDYPRETFDAVVSVFGLFFVDDMSGLLARAWRWLKPGGVVAVTSWGADVLAPGEALFWEAALRENPALDQTSHAARLDTAAKLAGVFAAAGLPPPDIAADRWEMPLPSPDSFWPVIMGTSNRAAYEALAPAQRRRVRDAVGGALRARCVEATGMDVLYAVARAPLTIDY